MIKKFKLYENTYWTDYSKEKLDRYIEISPEFYELESYVKRRLLEIVKNNGHLEKLNTLWNKNIDLGIESIDIFHNKNKEPYFDFYLVDPSAGSHDYGVIGEISISFEEFKDPELFRDKNKFDL